MKKRNDKHLGPINTLVLIRHAQLFKIVSKKKDALPRQPKKFELEKKSKRKTVKDN